ncbi:MAG: glutaredoxin 3 [Pseudomonadota bacterium]
MTAAVEHPASDSPKVEMYVKMTCPYCHRAKALLDQKGVKVEMTEISFKPKLKAEMVERSGGGVTVPQIFINGEPIGGCDDLYALEQAGKLDAKLVAAPA